MTEKAESILQDIAPGVSGILKKAGYFEEGAKKDLNSDTVTKRKIRAALDEKNHKLIERMWSDDPDLLNSVPQFNLLKENLIKTDMKRIIKETGKGPITQRKFEQKIDKSYLAAPSRLRRIERAEKHVTGLMKDQKRARKDKHKIKIWRNEPGACSICKAMNGQRRKIGEPYSNGSYVAHGHPGCVCYEDYE